MYSLPPLPPRVTLKDSSSGTGGAEAPTDNEADGLDDGSEDPVMVDESDSDAVAELLHDGGNAVADSELLQDMLCVVFGVKADDDDGDTLPVVDID